MPDQSLLEAAPNLFWGPLDYNKNNKTIITINNDNNNNANNNNSNSNKKKNIRNDINHND